MTPRKLIPFLMFQKGDALEAMEFKSPPRARE